MIHPESKLEGEAGQIQRAIGPPGETQPDRADPPPETKLKRGAQPGNTSAMRHGRRAQRQGLLQSRLPPGCAYVKKQRDMFRRELESLVEALSGPLSLVDIAMVQTATRWEVHAQLSARWLVEGTDFTPADKLAHSREVARASSERDRCLRALGLTVSATLDRWGAIYNAKPTLSITESKKAKS